MKNLNKNSNGFVSLNLSLILTIFISLYLTSAFTIALSQQRDYARSTCVNEATDLQASTLKNVRQIFALNKYSTFLRISITTTKIAIAAALAAYQAPLAAALQKNLDGLYETQNALDKYQKFLIFKARTELQIKQAALITKINSRQWDEARLWNKMITMLSVFKPEKNPQLAIRADSKGGVAPNYEWEPDAEKQLSLAYSWKMFFYTNDDYQTVLRWMNNFSIKCSVTPHLKEEQWQLTIDADK